MLERPWIQRHKVVPPSTMVLEGRVEGKKIHIYATDSPFLRDVSHLSKVASSELAEDGEVTPSRP